MSILNQLLNFTEDTPIIIAIIWKLVSIFIISILLLIGILKIVRFNMRFNEKNDKKLQIFYEKLLIEYLLIEKENPEKIIEHQKIIDKISKTLKRKRYRKILIKTFHKTKGQIAGDASSNVDELFVKLGLTEYSKRKLRKNNNWVNTAVAIRDLKTFNIKDAEKEVSKFINSKSEEVRQEVFFYFIAVFGFDGLSFLDKLTEPITLWTRIRILESLKKIELQEFPDPKNWLESENEYVVILALELVATYNLFDNLEVLTALLSHKNEKVRLKCIELFKEFYIPNGKEVLINSFYQRTLKEQVCIFKLLEDQATKEDEKFILKNINNSNFEIKVSALKILNSINRSKFLEFKFIFSNQENTKIIQHIEYS